MSDIPDTLITLPGRIARLCQNQRALTETANALGAAILADDWLAADGLADKVVELGNDIGLDAYLLSKQSP